MKSKILNILYENINLPVSGQILSQMLNVSRTAVWKRIKALVEEGYNIKSSGGKGYILTESDVLNDYELMKRMGSQTPFLFKKSVGSTNTLAKETARKNNNEFMLVTAENQEAGRGRLGRSFESDNNKGIWSSFILKPGMTPENALIITIASATAVCKTLEDICGLKTGIKWPNDIVSDSKKICGILSEMSCETGAIEFIVVGIGINISQEAEDFSKEVAQIATSVLTETGRKYSRAEIISSLCYNMQEIYGLVKIGKTEEISKRWRKYTVTDGKKIRIIKNNDEIIVRAEGIDEKGRLVVSNESGKMTTYNSGEISVRGIMGYS
ncbi:MAG: biotin--[acetyl-CoA-carboxylase] ligase [Clostridiales bacterium]|nr:biotin--[acetyl-CoA-carboxylase] ligase [Clostridiales bacterium]